MAAFNPKRLYDIRIIRGITLEYLAEHLGVTKQMVSKYERGDSLPSYATIATMASLLNTSMKYFSKSSSVLGSGTSTLFLRAPTSTTKKTSIQQARIICQWGYEITKAATLSSPKSLPININRELPIPQIATETRKLWGLGARPIDDMVSILESNGINVFMVDLPDLKTEAYSQIINGVPIVVLNRNVGTAVRQRFSLAHELGHLILHSDLTDDWEIDLRNKDIEREANLFAEYLLMPIGGFEDSFYSSKMEHLIPLKQRWGVSVGAIVMHCKHIGLIDEHETDQLQRQINARGWKKVEPLDKDIVYEEPIKMRNYVEESIYSQESFETFFDDTMLPIDIVERMCMLQPGFLTMYYEKSDLLSGHPHIIQNEDNYKQLSLFDLEG